MDHSTIGDLMSPEPRVKLLLGAPEVFPFDESVLTINEFLPTFRRLLFTNHADDQPTQPDPTCLTSTDISTDRPAWRSLLPLNHHLPTGFSQSIWLDNDAHRSVCYNGDTENGEDVERGDASFLTSTSSSRPEGEAHYDDDDDQEEDDDEEESEFLERSIALYDDVTSTPERTTTSLALSLSAGSLSSKLSIAERNASKTHQTSCNDPPPISAQHLTHLSHLPHASNLHRLQPQTLTTDLIASIIAVYPARRVTIRRTGAPIDLIEVLIGDETAAGFTVTFWVWPITDESPNSTGRQTQKEANIRSKLQVLRRGDVVLLRNVALTVFRGKVQGQSLGRRKRWGSAAPVGGETTVLVLWTRGNNRGAAFKDGDLDAETGSNRKLVLDKNVVLTKTRNVRDWTRRFVGAPSPSKTIPGQTDHRGSNGVRPEKRRRITTDRLPPDESQQCYSG